MVSSRTCAKSCLDTIVCSTTLDNHLQRLTQVFARIRWTGLKLKPSKCHLLQRHVHLLGNIVSKKGIHTIPAKTQAVHKWPTLQPRRHQVLHGTLWILQAICLQLCNPGQPLIRQRRTPPSEGQSQRNRHLAPSRKIDDGPHPGVPQL